MGPYSTVAGGCRNTVNGDRSGIIGGALNEVNDISDSIIVGGQNNVISHQGAVILGGDGLTTSREYEAIATTLTVSGSGTNLTDGKLVGIMTLANRTATPSSAPVGALMTSGSNLYFYGASGWVQIN